MIIRLTFGDSDCVHYITDFCVNLSEKMFDYQTHPEIKCPRLPSDFTHKKLFDEYLKKYERYTQECNKLKTERSRLMSPYAQHKKNTDDYRIICDEVRRLWLRYVKDKNLKGCEYIHISICHRLTEKDENGEVVYYFTAHNKSITM